MCVMMSAQFRRAVSVKVSAVDMRVCLVMRMCLVFFVNRSVLCVCLTHRYVECWRCHRARAIDLRHTRRWCDCVWIRWSCASTCSGLFLHRANYSTLIRVQYSGYNYIPSNTYGTGLNRLYLLISIFGSLATACRLGNRSPFCNNY